MSAVISDCGLYRYRLEREVQPDGVVFAYFGVNPSTADATGNDPTTRKWVGFAQRNGARRYIAGNPFAWRAKDVRELNAAADPIGPDNMAHLLGIIRDADVLIPCWGDRSKVPVRFHMHLGRVRTMILQSGKPVKVFGLTKAGDPMHPLMLGYDTQLVDWVTS